MENIEIARRLQELADLLEIEGANPFRIRAYRNAVRTVAGLTRPVQEMLLAGEDPQDLPGIGKDLAGYLRELVETGSLGVLDEVAERVPRELATLTRLDGVGPKRARKLWEELGITDVDALEAAAASGRVERLDGFGKRTVEKILRAIEDFRKHQARHLRHEAVQYLRPLLEHMREAPGVERLEVAGSFRRGRETVGDIDLLALVEKDPAAVMDHFTSAPPVERVEMKGDTRGSVLLASGLPVDLRILPGESWGAALHYFTGSKEHNVEIRKLGRKRGLRISEYGVFRMEEGDTADDEQGGGGTGGEAGTGRDAGREESDAATSDAGPPTAGTRIAGATEEEVFAAVDLPWIPPVLRENRGEIEAAARGELPGLVEVDDIRGDLHMHTTWSDGKNTIREMVEACRERGYAYMAVTDHSQAVTVAGGLTPERLRRQRDEVLEVRESVEGIRVLHGCEVDILRDGTLDLPDDALEELDIVLVAVHSHFGLDRDDMTRRVLRALAHPAVDVLVHPTGRLINRREPYGIDMEAVIATAVEHGVALELNASPHRLDLHDRHLFRARELGARISIGTDAHRIAQLEYMATGMDQARRGWLEPEQIVNCLDPEGFEGWLARRDA